MASQEEESNRGRRVDDEEQVQVQVQVHALAVPYPAQGHILPLFNLCHRLTTLIPYLYITFVNTSHNHRRMFDSHHHHHNQERIRLVEIDGGLPPEMHKDIGTLDGAYKAAEELIGPLDILMQGLRDVSFILSDASMSWTQTLARKFGIPRVAFLPYSAASFYIAANLPVIMAELPPPVTLSLRRLVHSDEDGSWDKEEGKSLQVALPPLPPFPLNDLFFVHDCRIIDALITYVKHQFPPMREASLILANSFHDLEKPIFEALTISWPAPIHPIGPVLPMPTFNMHVSLFKEDRSCLAWLDGQRKPKSVLYVSFGSIHEVKGRQFHELGLGLEASQHLFLWVIRDDSMKRELLPLLDRLGDRCFIVSWCPQVEVLSHPSVGGFLTHCGWNSVMESIASGVPMACWPHTSEQRFNARFVTEQWKLGIAFHRQEGEGGIVERREIERVVRGVFHDEGLQKTAVELSKLAKASLMEGGSSFTNLEAFIDSIRVMIISPPSSSCELP